MRLIGLMLLIVAPVFAGEYAVLATGARLHADRHEVDGVTVRLYNGDGYTQLPQTLISGYEPDGRIEPPVAPVAAPASAPPPTPSPEELADQRRRQIRFAPRPGSQRHGCGIRFPGGRGFPQRRHWPDAVDAGHGPDR